MRETTRSTSYSYISSEGLVERVHNYIVQEPRVLGGGMGAVAVVKKREFFRNVFCNDTENAY